MEVAELTAVLEATVAPLARQLEEANRLLASTKESAERTERAVDSIGKGFDLAPVVAQLAILNNRLRDTQREAKQTRREIESVGIGGGAAGLLSAIPGGARATGGAFAVGVASLATAVAPLLPALGAIAAIPSVVAPAVAALGVLALSGFGDVTKAIDGNKKAYNELLPAQKEFVNSVRELYPLLNGLKTIVASNLFGPIAQALNQVAHNAGAMSQIGGTLRGMSQFLGQVISQWIKFASSTQFLHALNQALQVGVPIWQVLSNNVQKVVMGFLEMAKTFAPLADYLTRLTSQAADWFKAWAKSKDAAAMNQTIIDSIRLLGQTVSAVLDVIRSLYDVLAPVGTVILNAINPALHDMARWLQQNSQFIDSLLISALRSLGKAFLGIKEIVVALGPLIKAMLVVLNQVLGALADAIKTVGDHIGMLKPIIEGITVVVQKAGKYILEAMLGPITPIVSNWSTLRDWFSTVAGDIAGFFESAGRGVINGLIGLLNGFLGPAETAINALIDGYNAVAGWATGNIPKIHFKIPSLGGGGGGTPGSIPSTGGVGPNSSPGSFSGSANALGGPMGPAAGFGLPGGGFNFGPTPVIPTGSAPPWTTSGGGGAGSHRKKKVPDYMNPFTGRSQGRIDQGVDFGGSGPIYAIGDGVVREASSSSGWPGGGWVSITLSSGSRAGWTYFVAEYIEPRVSRGQRVRKGQLIAMQTGGIEAGWVASPTQGSPTAMNALTSQLGMNARQRGISSDPGAVPTAEGNDFATFLNQITHPGASGRTFAVPHHLTAAQLRAQRIRAEHAAITSSDVQLLAGIGIFTQAASPGLEARYKAIENTIHNAHLRISKSVQHELEVLRQIMEQKWIDPRVKQIIGARLQEIQQTINAHVQAIKQDIQSIASIGQSIGSQILSGYEAIQGQYKSPAETKLEEMQREDQARQLAQNLADAQASGDAQKIADAQRAIQEYNLGQQAKDDQDAHDKQVKANKDALEKQLADLQDKLSRGKITWKQYQADIAKLEKQYGITPDQLQAATDWQTAQALFVSSMGDMKKAMDALSKDAMVKNTAALEALTAALNNQGKSMGGMPHAADGGIFGGVNGGLYRFAEAGAEAVIPLTKPARALQVIRDSLKRMNISSYADGGVVNTFGTYYGPPGSIVVVDGSYYLVSSDGTLIPLNVTANSSSTGGSSEGRWVNGEWMSNEQYDQYVNMILYGRKGGANEPGKFAAYLQQAIEQKFGGGGGSAGPGGSFGIGGDPFTWDESKNWPAHLVKLAGSGDFTLFAQSAPLYNMRYGPGQKHYHSPLYLASAGSIGVRRYDDFADVQGAAEGALVRARPGGRLIRVGEGGSDEAIIPLGRAFSGGEQHIHIHMDGREVAYLVTQRQLQANRMGNPGIQPNTTTF